MSPVDWYYARGNKQMGPVAAAELKRLAAEGEITPESLVWREGLTEWTAARNVRGLFEEESKPTVAEQPEAKPTAWADEAETAAEPGPAKKRRAVRRHKHARHLVDMLLDSFRTAPTRSALESGTSPASESINARFIETTAASFRDCGLYGLLVALLVAAAFTALTAVKVGSLANLLADLMLLLLLAALQYIAGKFCGVLDRLGRATTNTLSSTALPDAFALLCFVTGLAVLFGSVPAATQDTMYSIILLGIAGFVVFVFMGFVALNPSTTNILIAADESQPPSDEALGVFSFLLKVVLRSTPVAFGAGVIAGLLILGYATYEGLSDDLPAALLTAATARATLISSAALPLIVYLLFLLHWLLLDLCRTVLRLPNKPEEPTTAVEEQES